MGTSSPDPAASGPPFPAVSGAFNPAASGPDPAASGAPDPAAPGAAEPREDRAEQLCELQERIVECRRCPRLVAWREQVAVEKRAAFRDQTYWGRPVPGWGDPFAGLMVVGLAPAAHGANRTGRMFTGDRSGDWLYAALHRGGFANQPTSVDRDDGLVLHDVWITSPVKCAPPANKPTTTERDACRPFIDRELELLADVRVVLALGAFGWAEAARVLGFERRPTFGHGAEAVAPDGRVLIGSYHVSQQNTFTGRLTESMLDAVIERSRELIDTLRPDDRHLRP